MRKDIYLSNKTIHFCWFGNKPISITKGINSWIKFAPEYKIQLWNEMNIDITDCQFAMDAYKAKKWAFVSDYVRFKVIYLYGGIYMDVGSELIRPISVLEEKIPFSAFEWFTNNVNPGLVIAANPKDELIHEILNVYRNLKFVNNDTFLKTHTVNDIFTQVLRHYGLCLNGKEQKIHDWTILSSDVFCPIYGIGGYHVKKNTISIHHYSSSWCSEVEKKRRIIESKITPLFGRYISRVLSKIIAECRINGLYGFLNVFKKS